MSRLVSPCQFLGGITGKSTCAGRIECPLLVAHGENDRIVPLDSARKLYDAAGSKRKHLRIFTAAEGGAEHCQVDNRQHGVDVIADWLAEYAFSG